MYKRIVILLFYVFCARLYADGRKITVESRIDSKVFYSGVPFSYTILVDGSDLVTALPAFPPVKNLAVKNIDSKALLNGDKVGFVLSYLMVPEKAGDITIPPVNVVVGGKVFTTNKHTITVKSPESVPGLKLSVELSKKSCYVGEPFKMTFTWYSALPFYGFRGVNIDLPFFHDPRFKIFDGIDAVKSETRNSIGLPVSNRRIIAEHGKAEINENVSEYLRFTRVIVPLKVGELKIEPATLLVSYLTPRVPDSSKNRRSRPYRPQYPSYFNNNFFDDIGNKPYKRFFITSGAQEITVKPLPEAGKPSDFFGIVGRCNITTSVQPLKMHVGDPLTLTVQLKDYPYPSILSLPPFSSDKAFASNFIIPSKHSIGVIKGKAMLFQRILRPRRTGVAAVPQVRIPFFDQDTGKYGAAVAPAIPIEVLPAEVATTFDAELSGDNKLVNKVIPNPAGIRGNIVDEKAAFSDNMYTLKYLFAIFAIFPPICFLIIYIATANYRLRLNNPVRARAKFAARRFFAGLKKIKIPSDESMEQGSVSECLNRIDDVLRGYFSAKFNLQPHAHTIIDLKKRLTASQIPYDTIQMIERIYGLCSVNRYTEKETEKALTDLKRQAELCVRKVEKYL